MNGAEVFSNFTKEAFDVALTWMASIGGALIGVHFSQPENKKEYAIYFLTALLSSVFLGGWAIEHWMLEPRASGAVSFIIAIAGVYIVRAVILVAQNLPENLKSYIPGWIGRLTSIKKKNEDNPE